MNYDITIGLEVHAELSTETKIYCGCKNSFGAEVNTNTCPVCLALPGSLPVLNEKVVEYAVKAGHALNCGINLLCKQDRKHYFYPDLPKGYQISQYDIPLCHDGYVDILVEGEQKRIGITRIQIEEDTGKLLHDESFSGSLIDFNRCGVPLIEIISEPDLGSAAEVKAYLETIRAILQTIDVCDGKMEQGSIRCDVNISLKPKGQKEFGTRVEMKNINTLSGAYRAVEYETARQMEVLNNGGEIFQETRRWDDIAGKNFVMRSKENAQDYRFFQEPDLMNIVLTQEYVDSLKAEIPELPNYKIIRFMGDYNLSQAEAEQMVETPEKADLFETLVKGKVSFKTASNWVLGDISRVMNQREVGFTELNVSEEKLIELLTLIENKTISNAAAKEVFEELLNGNTDIQKIIKDKNLVQISDNSVLEQIADTVLAENANAVTDYKNGRTNVLGFLVGQCMKQSKGQGNPGLLKEIILEKIEKL